MKLDDQLKTQAGGAVRISMAASVANDLDAFKKGIVAFAERLGCPECFSGFDCTFESQRDFVLRPGGEVERAEDGPGQRVSRGARQRTATIGLSPRDEYDLGSILETIDLWGKRLGAHWEQGGQAWCCSGFDVTLERELQVTLGADDLRR